MQIEMSNSVLIGLILGVALWLWTLISLLGREDMKDTDKIVWTIVVCTLNVVGMILYWLMAPSEPHKVRTEQELKDYFNSRDTEPTKKA